ncbi:Oocyte zinc finger protein XlCOF7.1 [Eumeta japonica]|uniref:Oocyte zinc finger protein XlCOF7.1 n=1 Tax=Eumeta variegata TaxID=151549 RepID=A0A4C1YV49_EUMVA|nr:Oocyte zinc finger protein XlCOF7.1 [Eumeta japonica]
MDTELKIQLQVILRESALIEDLPLDDTSQDKESDDLGNDPVKQLEAMIKTEPNDNDDDCYYVLVIDDSKDKENNRSKEKEDSTKLHKITHMKKENIEPSLNIVANGDSFENSIDSFLVTDPKVPINVPATILQNEEDSNSNLETPAMDVEEENSRELSLVEHNGNSREKNDAVEQTITELVHTMPDANNLIKILTTASSDGTILFKGADGQKVAYLTDTQLISDGDALSQEEVIVCEGDESNFQIVKCEGSELVIEYTDEGEIAVLQQEDGTFLCECGEQFENYTEYEKHQFTHNPAGDLLCNMCGKGFESQEILTGHMLLHNMTGLFIMCPFCNQLIKRNALTQHIKYGHNNIKPRCKICLKTFANPNNLKRHMMIHSGIKQFECDICFKRFHQKITMQTHRLTHITPFTCNGCEKTFENKLQLESHKENEECSKVKISKIKDELTKTLKQEVSNVEGEILGYSCTLCKKMFSLEFAFEQHVENSHMVDPMELLCSECGEVLPSKKEMQSHLSTHKHAKMRNLKRFDCSICGKGCASQAMLVMHERVHTNERPFPCQLCSLRFKTKTHLRTHQLTHTREKKFGCSVCMKFFALKDRPGVSLASVGADVKADGRRTISRSRTQRYLIRYPARRASRRLIVAIWRAVKYSHFDVANAVAVAAPRDAPAVCRRG